MEKVRKIGHDDGNLFEMAHEMVPQPTFVSGVMNFLASNGWMTYSHSQRCIIFKGENGTGWSVRFNSATFVWGLTSDVGPFFKYIFWFCRHSAVAAVTGPPTPSSPNNSLIGARIFLPDLITRIQNAAFCQQNGMQAEKNQREF